MWGGDITHLGKEMVCKTMDSCVEEGKFSHREEMMGDKESFYPNPEVAC